MRWPAKAFASTEQLVMAWADQALAYVYARPGKGGVMRVERCGVERQGEETPEEFAKRLGALGFKGQHIAVMLRPAQYQIFQIDSPAVAPEEMRTAARWQVKDMVDVHMDDLTLDVVRVGDERVRATGTSFVVTASNALLREIMALGRALRGEVTVIDIQDMAQRNLQSAVARQANALERAQATLVLTEQGMALLTISAYEELFYTRRIELGVGFLQESWQEEAGASIALASADLNATPAEFDNPFSTAYAPAEGAGLYTGGGNEHAQRLVVEVQRSLDLWDRTWPMLSLSGISVYAGARSMELAQWLQQELGTTVRALDVSGLFPGFEGLSDEDQILCWPLLGILLRSHGGKD